MRLKELAKPAVTVASPGIIDYAELTGTVTVGEESAKRLSEVLGRKVEPGETFDLGTLAVYHKNPFKRFWETLKIKKHLFN